jgi:signal transduction histidine kinase/ligand-binding sensor domain-containing protein
MHGVFGQSNIGFIFAKASCFLLLVVFAARAERLPVKVYTSDDGLGSSASFNLVRDSRGFIWLCSRDGLVRFDGYRFITYRIGDDDADPAVFDLIPTRRGAYWIDLNRGMDYRFVPPPDKSVLEPIAQTIAKNDSRVPLKAEPIGDEPLPSFEDSLGNLWNSTNKGINLLREADGKLTAEFIEVNLPGLPKDKLNVLSFVQGENNAFWLGTNWGLVRRLSDGRMIHYLFDPKNGADVVRYLAEDKQGRVWIARSDGLMVLKIDSASEFAGAENFVSRRILFKPGIVNAEGQPQLPETAGEAVHFSFADVLRRETKEEAAKANNITPNFYKFICGADGKIWMPSNHGLVVFDGKNFQQYTIKQGLATNIISSIAEDYEGHIWLASYGGLHRLNPKGLKIFDQEDGLESDRIHSIYEDRNGDLNVVSGNFNISRLNADGKFKMIRPRLPANSIWAWSANVAYLDSHGDWWVNTFENIYRYTNIERLEDLNGKAPTEIYNESNGLLSNNNVRVFEDSNGDMWFCPWVTSERFGLTRWQRSTGEIRNFTTADGLPEKPIASAFAEDAAGNLWFGFTTGSNGIARYRDGRFTIISDPNILKAGISDIYRDRAGRMWIATNGEGLFRVDVPEAEQPIFRRYQIADGLTSENVRCVTEDLYGNIYVGTVRGVNRLSPETGQVRYYGTSDGLASDFINTAFRDRHGVIWFGTFNGLSKLVPEADAPLPAPSILISGLRIAGEEYSVSPLGQREVFVSEQDANRNNLQIDFLSVNTGGNTFVRYQYRLEGAGDEWSEPTAQNSVTFANLSSGSYRFFVLAVNADDVASLQPAVVSFTVLRPIWQRWWFLSLAALAISTAIYTLYSYRVKQIIKLERVRTRIATDLHDDIGSSLSQIAILSEVVRQKVGDGANGAGEPLNLIADTSREMVDSMSDIVWAVNPAKDHLSDLTQRMRRFASDILEAQNIGYKFIVAENAKDITLGADVRREVYLMFKECVTNLVKYSSATDAILQIKIENGFVCVQVEDNGRGFDVEKASKGFGGNGLPNMKKRATGLGGKFEIHSEKEKGTKIQFSVPLK